MFLPSLQRVATGCALFTMAFLQPTSVDASWLSDLFGRKNACQTECDPVSVARPSVQQVYRYVPQTCYRTVCETVPTTTYRPVTTRDPCTGCQQTCLRPMTTYVRQARRVPYTTYRPVLMNVYYQPVAVAGSCNTCPNAGVALAGAPGCNSCSPAMTTGALPATQAAPYDPLAPRAQGGLPAPALPPSTPGTDERSLRPPATLQQPTPDPRTSGESSVKTLHESHHPIPSLQRPRTSPPRQLPQSPGASDRVTWQTPQSDWAHTAVSWPSPGKSPTGLNTSSGRRETTRAAAAPATLASDDGGWSSGRR